MQDHRRAARFLLVAAAHHVATIPIPASKSELARLLQAVLDTASNDALLRPDVDAVLLRTLHVLGLRLGPASPSLVEQYLLNVQRGAAAVAAFVSTAQAALARASDDGIAACARQVIVDRCDDPSLGVSEIAERLGTRPAAVSAAFRKAGLPRCQQQIRDARLERAAAQFRGATCRVKDVWANIGYNHAANFNHDFKVRFGVSPRKYRQSAHDASAWEQPTTTPVAQMHNLPRESSRRVVVIDDDEGTRDTLGAFLRFKGFLPLCSGSVREGLLHCEQGNPYAVIVDYHLPDGDGLTCLRTIRRMRLSSLRHLILLTADWEVERLTARIRALGATLHSKMESYEDLCGAIDPR